MNTVQPIPQILSITRVSSSGNVKLRKGILSKLTASTGACRLHIGDDSAATNLAAKQSSIILSPAIVDRLHLKAGSHVAFVESSAGLRLKRIALVVDTGDHAEAFDIEGKASIERTLVQNPAPELSESFWLNQSVDLRLKYPVSSFLQTRSSIAAYQARQLIGSRSPDDVVYVAAVAEQIGMKQEKDGSWEHDLVLTAKNITTLIAVGQAPSTHAVQCGCEWLLNTRGSPHNPGMFFLSEELAAEQVEVVQKRAAGEKARFRSRKKTEMKNVNIYDPLIIEPCGPRIMWPNAFALDALLAAGYEGHPRIRENIATLMDRRWCECGYQHGIAGASPKLEEETVAAVEHEAAHEYRMGGLSSPDELLQMFTLKTSGRRMRRVKEDRRTDHTRYELDFDGDFPTCGFVTMEALGRISDPLARRFADARMMGMAANMPKTSRRTVDETVRFWRSPYAAALRGFHRYRHPAARAVILRAVPWIIETQNDDGSWGEDPYKDDTTLAILKALTSVSSELPKLGLS